jgi:ATP-dependent DNA helicase Rep
LKLNPAQKQAVAHSGSPVLVLAGAGSGKTGVITKRIVTLISDGTVNPENIYAVTFTNKAAREMQHRVASQMTSMPKGRRHRPVISTFHRLGLTILSAEAEHIGIKKGFSIVDSRDAVAIIGDLLQREFGVRADQAESVRNAISALKNNSGVSSDVPDNIAKVRMAYDRYLRVCNAVDLDDMITLPVQLLSENSDVRNRWRSKIHYLLVDEYQDTNDTQYEMVKLLAGSGSGLMAVGDDDQSIYAWRGARPQNLMRLESDFPDLTLIKLEQNYRSRGRILKLASHLIENNPRPFVKTLWSELGYGDAIRVIQSRNDIKEAEQVISEIMADRFQSGLKYSDFAILYRSNYQSRILELKLMELQVPYLLSGGKSFFDRTEVRDIMCYLKLIANPSDDSALFRIINTPRRGVGASTLEQVNNWAVENRITMSEAIFNTQLTKGFSSRASLGIEKFCSVLEELRAAADHMDPAELISSLVEKIDYWDWLQAQSDNEDVAKKRLNNITELGLWMNRMKESDGERPSLVEIIRRLTLSDMLDRQNQDEEDTDGVSLMTLHAAKGLEFNRVCIVGVEEDILPHVNSQNEASIQEERRLFYVGITRAKVALTLSMAAHRKRFGEIISCTPSRFLEELPPEDLNWTRSSEQPVAEQKKVGKAHLAGIRDILVNKTS